MIYVYLGSVALPLIGSGVLVSWRTNGGVAGIGAVGLSKLVGDPIVGTFTAYGTALHKQDGYPGVSTLNQAYKTLNIVGGMSSYDNDSVVRPALLVSMGFHDWFTVDLRGLLDNAAIVENGILYPTTVSGNDAQGAIMDCYINGDTPGYAFFTVAIAQAALETVTMPSVAASDPTNLVRAIYLGTPLSSTPPVDSAWVSSSGGGSPK